MLDQNIRVQGNHSYTLDHQYVFLSHHNTQQYLLIPTIPSPIRLAHRKLVSNALAFFQTSLVRHYLKLWGEIVACWYKTSGFYLKVVSVWVCKCFTYAEWGLHIRPYCQSVILLSVFMLSVITLSVIMLSCVMRCVIVLSVFKCQYAEGHYSECRF
jgi:hypothetical protein